MPRTSRSPSLAVLAVTALVLAAPAAAEDLSAGQWLEKLMALYDRGPFTFAFSADVDLGAMGQPIRGTLDGKFTYGDRQHLRQEMAMSLSGLPGADGQTPAKMDILSVNDGEQTWTEVAMMGTRQVMKISHADAEKLAGQSGALGANPATMDPVAQIETLSRTMDFELVGVADGRVSLRAKAGAEGLAQLGQLGALGVDEFLLVLDQKTGFPVELKAGEPPVIHMTFRDLKLVDRGDLPAEVFDYRPPEGLPVTDLGAMVGIGSQ